MSWFLRRVKPELWKYPDWLPENEVHADVILDFRKIKNNALSVYEISVAEDLDRAIGALGGIFEQEDYLHYVLIESAVLESSNIKKKILQETQRILTSMVFIMSCLN